jgi:hypothetical protein
LGSKVARTAIAMRRRDRRWFAVPAFLALASLQPAHAQNSRVVWEQWHVDAGVVDVAGPLSNGQLVVAAGPHLYAVTRDGVQTELSPAYATPPYAPPAGAEAYIAVATTEVTGGPCGFVRDTVFAIRPGGPAEVIAIDPGGAPRIFAALPDAGSLNGITFDTTGSFGRRLLVTGGLPGSHTAVVAVDCHGSVETLTRTAPQLEGGITVAPASFGSFGGDLIAPDELSGRVLAIGPTGGTQVVVASNVPSGPDIGVESAGFVPPGFLAGGAAYTADRSTPGNPHPGTDHVLRLSAAALADVGVREGDLLLATEGSDVVVDVRCQAACRARDVGMGATAAHGEGHVLVVADRPGATPAAGSPPAVPSVEPGPPWVVLGIAIVGAGVVLAVGGLTGNRKATRKRPPSGS